MGLDGGTYITRSDVLRGQSWELNKNEGSRSTRGGAVTGVYKRAQLDPRAAKWVFQTFIYRNSTLRLRLLAIYGAWPGRTYGTLGLFLHCIKLWQSLAHQFIIWVYQKVKETPLNPCDRGLKKKKRQSTTFQPHWADSNVQKAWDWTVSKDIWPKQMSVTSTLESYIWVLHNRI